jgi:hypothetical protein
MLEPLDVSIGSPSPCAAVRLAVTAQEEDKHPPCQTALPSYRIPISSFFDLPIQLF